MNYRYRKRKHKDSPLFLKISDIYRRSILKKYSNVISDVSHNAFEFFFQSSLNCLRIRWIRRSLDILRVFFGATVLFFLYAGFAKNSYRDGVNNRKRETDDKSVELLFDNKKSKSLSFMIIVDKYNRAIVLLLLRTEDNEESRQLDTLDWLLLANHHKEYGHDEL